MDGEDQYNLKGAHVLIVEDNEINQQLAIELFENEGGSVEIASNGLEAVNRVLKAELMPVFDMVLMDIQMPKMDGQVSKTEAQKEGLTQQSGMSEEIEIPFINGIDVVSGLKRVAENKKLYLDFLRKFVKGQENIPEMIEEALKAEDCILAERLADTLRGVAGNIGADGVQEVAAEFELAIRKNDSDIHTQEIPAILNLDNPSIVDEISMIF